MTVWPGSEMGVRLTQGKLPRTAVKPERPGLDRTDLQQPGAGPRVLSEARPDLLVIGGLDHVQGFLAIADRAAQDQEAVVNQPIHECRVPSPAILLPDGPRRIPAR